METKGPLRVLVVHGALGWRENEGGEIADVIYGLLRRVEATGGQMLATDARALFRVERSGDDVDFVRIADLAAVVRADVDVVHVHMVTKLRRLLLALLFRLRGVPVVCSPMGMLGDDFATRSWFRQTSRVRLAVKRAMLRARRSSWRVVATTFVCTSRHEARQAHLPAEKVILLPLPVPRSTLAQRAIGGEPPPRRDHDAFPIAYVGRFDVRRKGIDRLAAWLEASRAEVPHPALRLFAPQGDLPAAMDALVADGIVDWDQHTTGAELAETLGDCRGLVLLTRYEGQPRVLREAVLLGLPVITTVSSNFAEVIDTLGAGVVVDGDRPSEVQAAFHSIADLDISRSAAAQLLDREHIGAFLHDQLVAVADGAAVARDYYAQSSRVSG